jgi:HEAT repeat protein
VHKQLKISFTGLCGALVLSCVSRAKTPELNQNLQGSDGQQQPNQERSHSTGASPDVHLTDAEIVQIERDIAALGDADSARVDPAFRWIAARGRTAVPRLLQELERNRLGGIGRARILWLLGHAGTVEALPALIAALHDPLYLVRTAAIDATASFADPRARTALVNLLLDRDPDIVVQAALRLGDRREPESTGALGQLLLRSESGIRYSATRALARLGTPEARQILRAHLASESDDEVRSLIQVTLTQ